MKFNQSELKSILHYNPDTGLFTRIKNGSSCGSLDTHGYLQIRVNGRLSLAHRLVWMYVYGRPPTYHIDHINGVKNDNRLSNLREVTVRQNQVNRKRHRMGKLSGVTFDESKHTYNAKIQVKGQNINLGIYASEAEAHDIYLKAISVLCPEDTVVVSSVEEPKPPKRMAPCIFRYTLSDPSSFGVSDILFSSREEAKDKYSRMVQWPAIPNKDGFYEFPQE